MTGKIVQERYVGTCACLRSAGGCGGNRSSAPVPAVKRADTCPGGGILDVSDHIRCLESILRLAYACLLMVYEQEECHQTVPPCVPVTVQGSRDIELCANAYDRFHAIWQGLWDSGGTDGKRSSPLG